MVALKAKTLAETLVAMIIITAVMAMWSNFYLKVAAQTKSRQDVCARNLLEEAKRNAHEGSQIVNTCGSDWLVTISPYEAEILLVEIEQLEQQPPIIQRAYVQRTP